MTYTSYLSIALLFIVSTLCAQDDVSFKYSELPILTWEDFRGEPQLNSSFHANTNSGFSYSWSYSTSNGTQELDYEVFSTFYPMHSWVHPDHKVEHLLKHEQLHFDISEIHARKLRKAMKSYVPGRSVRKDLKNLYASIEQERIAMQNAFDAETNHSTIKTEEERWQLFVKAELKKLEPFKE